MESALLVLEDGTIYHGTAWASRGRTLGEIVFSTAMTGYQETFTDPSYYRQIIVMTAPHIGNTGVNEEDPESRQYWAAGVVVREGARRSSNWRATEDLEDSLARAGIVGIQGVDTRAITRHLREQGVMRAGIFSGSALPAGAENGDQRALDVLIQIVRDQPEMAGAHLAGEVSTEETYTISPLGEKKARVVAVDLGIKARTPAQMAARGMEVVVVPASVTFEQIAALEPDGVFFSNGPGDPGAAMREVELLREVLRAGYPFFGICFGNQLLGRALGFGTYKLEYGHRGVNQPVLDRTTGKVEITAHNHGFAVDVPVEAPSLSPYEDGLFGRVEVSHLALNDNVVEGLKCLDIPAFSVQYHPEAAAGPHDASYLFDRFLALMTSQKEAE